MSKWLDGLLCAETILLKGGYKYANTYYDTHVWSDDYGDFEIGYQDYLDNYKFRRENND